MRVGRYALSVIQNRLGATPRPSWCTYLVTYRCNARCRMCDSWRMKPGDELTPAQIRAVFAKIGKLDVVRLSGGEPFLREDMTEIVDTIARTSKPLVIHITTNGSFPERVVELIKRCQTPRLLRFMVSFDGAEETHDANRGADVTFAKALECVRRIAELRSEFGVEVSANHTVISKPSLEDSAKLKALLRPLGCDVHSVLAYSDSAMYGAKRRGQQADDLITQQYPLHPDLADADVQGFVRRELDDLGELRAWWLRRGKRYYLRGLQQRLNGDPRPRPNPKCVALRSHIRLLPDGRVPVCQFNTQTVGGLRDEPFDAVWHGAAARSARKWVDACAGCWAECEVTPNAIYSGDILRA